MGYTMSEHYHECQGDPGCVHCDVWGDGARLWAAMGELMPAGSSDPFSHGGAAPWHCDGCGAATEFGEQHSHLCPVRWEHLLTLSLCSAVGHDWEDHGHAGPDSGCDDKECARCGLYVSIPMY